MSSASRHDYESLFVLSGTPAMGLRAEENLVVLTQDAELLATLQAVGSGRRIATVTAEADLAVHLLSDHGGVAVIDVAATASPIVQLTERLKRQFPDLVLVVAGDTEDQSMLSTQIGSGVVYRFLHKPLSEQRVRLFIDAAWRRHGEEHAGITGFAATRTVPVIRQPRSLKGLWLMAILAAVAVGGLWFTQGESLFTQTQHEPQQSAPTPASVAVPRAEPSPIRDEQSSPEAPAPESVAAGVIARAEVPQPPVAHATETVVSPPPSMPEPEPAPAGKPSQAAVTPVDTAAQDKQRQLAERLVAEARKAFAANDVDEGGRWMQAAQEAGISEENLEALGREAERARLALRAETITRLARQFDERLAQGKLIEPANDSAKFYLAQLQQTEADHPSTQLAQQTLASRFVAEARTFLPRQDFAAARRWLLEARSAGADAASVTAVENEITVAQIPAPRAAGANKLAPTSSLKQLKHVDPEYPQAARASGATGWVDVAYTVRGDGTVADVDVIKAQPAGVFDKAAVAAVRKWRYEPLGRAGQVADQRTKVRIRFELE